MQQFPIEPPSNNPGEELSLTGVLDFFQKQLFIKLEKVAPAQIISYDAQTNRAVVQVLNYSVTTSGEKIQRKPLEDIPVSVFGGSLFGLRFPIKTGDLGFIIAADCNISVFKKVLQLFTPASYQRHKYKDGVFFPLIINGFTVAKEDEEAVILTSIDGATSIKLTSTEITLASPSVVANATDINLNGVLTINGEPYLSHTHSNGNEGNPTGGVIQ